MIMDSYIWLIPLIPIISFLVLALSGRVLSKRMVAVIGVSSVVMSAILTVIAAVDLLSSGSNSEALVSKLYTWFSAGNLSVDISFRMDSLSMVFCFVITFVGALIHLYSTEFMKDDEGFSRFFAYMNLFVGSMLILVLADNLLLLYLGWEGVGLCSYLLIGFWYKDPVNGSAAQKAFIVTRIGDTAMIIGLFLLFISFRTLNTEELMQNISASWPRGSTLANISALLLLGGALGKSAQLPLQTWLPDAMAGPSPVSALIHAATMVTAGVYLIARTHLLFMLAPFVQTTGAVIGAATLLYAGFSAMAQVDLKRILAYSTISQIGYMFLALGIGAWSAAIFHFMIHAFFKALLFLAAGCVIEMLHHEHNIFRMGGLRKKMPVVFITFLIGGASLSALPLITAGFYSKDAILWFTWSSAGGSKILWLAGIAGAFMTSLYTFRMIFITFFGETKTEPAHKPGPGMVIPLIILASLSIIGGFIELPENFAPVHIFSDLMKSVLPSTEITGNGIPEYIFQILSAVISIGGIYLAWLIFIKKSLFRNSFINTPLSNFFLRGWGFDWVYNKLIVRPVVWLSEIDKKDFIDQVYTFIATGTGYFNQLLSKSQNGRLRWYLMVLTIGIIVILTIMLNI
jgi:NADH-quinone oxidoreductase subunit L